MAEVAKVLDAIGASDVRQLIVLNKLDLTGLPPAVERNEYGMIEKVRLSAKCGDGLSLLRDALSEIAGEKRGIVREPSSADDVGDNPEDETNTNTSL